MNPRTVSAAPGSEEDLWVEGELVRSVVRSTRSMQSAGLLMVALLVAVLWDDAAPAALLVWTAAAGAMAALRFTLARKYTRDLAGRASAEQLAFFRRYRLFWPASALIWGSATILFFDVAPVEEQFIGWLVLAGLAMFSINNLSAHLPTMRAYLDTLAFTSLGVVVWRVGSDLGLHPPHHYWLIALMLIFWQLLRHAGLRLHLTHRRNFELQFRNKQLIESLTGQTQAALEAVEIKNRFLASAAHDIRQPVHALGLYADWLSSEPELVHEIGPKILQSTQAVNALFDSLFDLVRLDSGKIRLNIEPVGLSGLLQDLELQYRPLAKAKGLRFRVRGTPGMTVSDPILLRRILGNLIANAIKYTERGGILVAARASTRGLRLEIWDTGVGIAAVHQREIFREFYKVPGHGGTEDGFGLGLSIVTRLAHILGHPLEMASRPGRGSVFRLTLTPTDAQEAANRALAAVAQLSWSEDRGHGRSEASGSGS